jgi:hypothetical protein
MSGVIYNINGKRSTKGSELLIHLVNNRFTFVFKQLPSSTQFTFGVRLCPTLLLIRMNAPIFLASFHSQTAMRVQTFLLAKHVVK